MISGRKPMISIIIVRIEKESGGRNRVVLNLKPTEDF
jgi:hypothetical protein